jgi:magnesium chelatase subunit D
VAASFPFSAIVGQHTLKRALLLGVIHPALGGVLIRGTKGVAKSTAVRALASLLPPLDARAGCPFHRAPAEDIPDWPLPPESPVVHCPLPLVELPLGATEDRVLGTLHLEKALRGERVFEPGLLAAAHHGILYIDEVNLLPDHLVDVLLDAAASGVHRVEREGLSLTHPARFLLVGTMNPEEGELRPQLLDRFGLVVDVTDLRELSERAEAVRRRLAFEGNPAAFVQEWHQADREEATRVCRAQGLLSRVHLSDAHLKAISERCVAAGVEGLRADLTLSRAACAWAAYQGRTEVTTDDLEAVAELALAHRRTTPPEPPEGPGTKREGQGAKSAFNGSAAATSAAGARSEVLRSSGPYMAGIRPPAAALGLSTQRGRWRQGRNFQGRNEVSWGFRPGGSFALAATIRAAAPYQQDRRQDSEGPLILRPDDLRVWRRRASAGCLLLFLVDASGSMAAWQRMRQTKAAIMALLRQAYRQRDLVALMAFHHATVDLVLPPRRGLANACRALEALPVGGTTPLAAGLGECRLLIRALRRKQPQLPTWTVIFTDGRANIGTTSGDPWQDALEAGRRLGSETTCLVVDTEGGWPRFGRAGELACVMGASHLALEDVLGRPYHVSPTKGLAS